MKRCRDEPLRLFRPIFGSFDGSTGVTPEAFIAKWDANTRNEQAASKEHFLDLCALLDVRTPNSDATGAIYAFEKGAAKAGSKTGWADVWRRGCFGWEYKSRGGDLDAAHVQLLGYASACGRGHRTP